ncbi:MAG: hypothetical protein ACLQLG_17635, partial [Thermoguttaceae bacterium]
MPKHFSVSRRSFLTRSLAVFSAAELFGAAARAGDSVSSAAGHDSPSLRAMFSQPFDLEHPYWPGTNWLRFK